MLLDLLIILAAGLLGGLVCRWLNLPLMLGYLVVGVVISRAAFGWVDGHHKDIHHIAEAGVILLLFTIGLEFSLNEVGKMGRYLLIGGGVQMLLVALPVGALLYLTGRTPQASALLAAAVAFSSTVVVFRILTELGQTGAPHGQRAVGVLLFQDAALVPLLLVIPLLTGGETVGWTDILVLIGSTAGLIVAVIVLRYIVRYVAAPQLAKLRSPELVLLSAVVILGVVTYATVWLELPAALGAFAAGLIFNGNRLTAQVDALILPFRQTFSAIFFVSLGLLLQPGILQTSFVSIGLMLLAVLSIKAAAAIVALRLTALPWRSAVGMGVGLAHLGEFSLVLGLEASKSEVIHDDDYQKLLCVGLLSLILTPFLLRWGLRRIAPVDRLARDAAESSSHDHLPGELPRTALVIGAGLIGRQVTSQLETMGCDVCLVDLSPVNLHPFALQGFHTVAGDARDAHVLRRARVEKAELVVLVVPDDDAALSTLRTLRDLNKTVPVIVRCRYHGNEHPLREAGAAHVISEESRAAQALLKLLSEME